MAEQGEGCATPSAGPIIEGKSEDRGISERKEMLMELAKVGKEAPDFELTAFHNGSFKNIKLSDYKGKWLVICFYPGDFTFV